MNEIKYSIIIGTLNHCNDLLKPCLEAIIKHTDLSNVEVIVVSNGSTDNTREYVESLGEPFKLVWFDKPLGYAKANNEGVAVAKGQYLILLNNDAFLIDQPKNKWIKDLEAPFLTDPTVGISGPLLGFSDPAGDYFLVFFCVMVSRACWYNVGGLSEDYGVGGGEDTEMCLEAKKLGYKVVGCSEMNGTDDTRNLVLGPFPIFHLGEATMNDNPDWSKIFKENSRTLAKKYNPKWLTKDDYKVLCSIATKDRYDILSSCLMSVALQTRPPNAVTIFDDGEQKDLRNDPVYKHLFKLFDLKKIKWSVTFTPKKGQQYAHDMANKTDYDLIWRLDDDEIAEPDVLERLLGHMKEDVGAVAGAVFEPGNQQPGGSNKISDVFHMPNLQWAPGNEVKEVEHLYSSFLYRPRIVDYNLDLSPVCHREETIFTNRLFNKGYKLIVDTSIKTYHFRQEKGGIRSHTSGFFYDHDDAIFLKYLEEQGYKVVSLDLGLGDHFVFLKLLPELQQKYNHIIIGCCYPQAFEGISNITVTPVGVTQPLVKDHLYKFMVDNNWKTSMIDAMRKMLAL